ncbi:Polyketide cyclase / dehydrase and lipid transport [Natronoarchaeum philippinense]|uniref:Polyketide cyclase / dehydrase and lipid transport n=1 Tax=Natronoarchaeum philippinense TaxID=558529 RepID=A0A285MZG1_NATPI|nr:SRPBCC family protein [Natronoarchaeum philippinense]SNZ02582.1 Polyketide cyclase / dehydrase and lipid transport [Natronoarchaeum philippinense]
MDRVQVSTLVYLPPEDIYEFLEDFPGYANYSKYLQDVRRDGTGEEGTRYDLEFAWWKLEYTAQSEVTDTTPPERIDWRLVTDLDAQGYWRVDHQPEAAPQHRETASRVHFVVEYDPSSASAGAVDLPALVSMGWVIDKLRPKVLEEAERIVERIVADLEGERRDVELQVHDAPSSV